MNMKRRSFICMLPVLGFPVAWNVAYGQAAYPNRPVTLVVGSPPGGQSDLIARYLANAVARELNQTFVVDNKPGANGIVALQYAARQPADGYTLAYGVGSWMAINPGFYPNLPYDPQKDFDPITQIGITPQCLMLGAHVPAKNLAELIALAKASPGKFTFASFGNGSSCLLQGEMLKVAAGIDMLHVPFKGSAPALTEVVAGRVDMFIIDFAPAVAFIKQGRIRPLAMTGTKRYPGFPEVPTFQELGYPLTMVGWNGLFVPSGTPREIESLLNQKFNAVIRSDEGRSKLLQLGALATGTTPDEYRQILKEDIAKWREVIVRSGARQN